MMKQCEDCDLTMLKMTRYLNHQTAENYFYCPKCKKEIVVGTEECWIESESDFYLRVILPEKLSSKQIQTLINVDDELREQPKIKAVQILRGSSEKTIGPFWPKGAMEKVKAELETVGLKSKMN